MNLVPWLMLLSTSIVPLCNRTMCFTIERPKPVPFHDLAKCDVHADLGGEIDEDQEPELLK